MASTSRQKGLDKHEVCRRLIVALKKRYPAPPKAAFPVLETMLYAACLENAPDDVAQQSYQRIFSMFHDLNEVRVSSVYELAAIFPGQPDADLRAYRVRCILQHVFEDKYAFEYESLTRKTMEQATKTLTKLKPLTPFIRAYVMNHSLDNHVLPFDEKQVRALIWLGLCDEGSNAEHCSDLLKSFVRKADAPLFCHLLRCLTQDPKIGAVFEEPVADETLPSLDRLELAFQFTGRRKPAKDVKPAKPVKETKETKDSKAPKAKKPAVAQSATKKAPAKKAPPAAKAPPRKK